MGRSICISVLLLALAPALLAQSTTSISLGNVGRQSGARANRSEPTWDDQTIDFGRDYSGTPCGAPLPSIQNGYITSLFGKPLTDLDISRALLHWLDKHPDLDLMRPKDIAKIVFPSTSWQIQQREEAANLLAEHWASQIEAAEESGDRNLAISTAAALMNTRVKSSADVDLTYAVQAEEQRRVRSDGSAADRLQEAINLYSICESRRQVQFEEEVEKLAKQEFQQHFVANMTANQTAQGK